MLAFAPIKPFPVPVAQRRFGKVPAAASPAVTCRKCNLRESCLSGGVPDEDLASVENIVYARRRIRRGEPLLRAGDEFKCIYAIRSGFFKTSHADGGGREQITGFYMAGELLGLDGLASGRCEVSATALEDSDVCAMPYALIESIGGQVPSLRGALQSVLAREIVRDHGIMLLLGSMCAEERIAAFLLNLSWRFALRGYSGSDLVLRMTRNEIGSYLGLQLETVSRIFSQFREGGLLEVHKRNVTILDGGGLEGVLASRNWREARSN